MILDSEESCAMTGSSVARVGGILNLGLLKNVLPRLRVYTRTLLSWRQLS